MKGEHILNYDLNHTPPLNLSIENLSQAIFVVNRHAKTATNPRYLYKLKQEALKKLIEQDMARKIGLHFSGNPKNSQQQSDVLVKCGSYTFHIPPIKRDFTELPHLGKLDNQVRNPKTMLSLNAAKTILQSYTGIIESDLPLLNKRINNHTYQKPVFKKLGDRY